MAAIIQLVDGRTLTVSESVDQVQDAIASLEPGVTPMIRLTKFGSNQSALVIVTSIASVETLE